MTTLIQGGEEFCSLLFRPKTQQSRHKWKHDGT